MPGVYPYQTPGTKCQNSLTGKVTLYGNTSGIYEKNFKNEELNKTLQKKVLFTRRLAINVLIKLTINF